MNFKLEDEHLMVKDLARKFVLKYVEPIAKEIDLEARYPSENIRKAGEIGIMGVFIPQEYGGGGLDTISYAIMLEEIARVCASTAIIISANSSLACYPLYKFGNEEQKKRYLVPLASGEKLGAFGLTEPGAGTDAAAQKTAAQKKGEYYFINGSKVFITNGPVADTFIIFAVTDKERGLKGLSAFIVEKGMEGFSIGSIEDTMGIRASQQSELIFQDLKVPKENLLGKEGEGFLIAMQTLDCGRIGVAAQALGIAQGALDKSVQYAKERVQFGKPIGKFQAISFMLADMETRVQAARYLVYAAAFAKDSKEDYSKEAAMAKLFASETAVEVTTKTIQIYGGYGYTRDYLVERYFRDAKITEIYEGTSEVQKMVIAKSLGL